MRLRKAREVDGVCAATEGATAAEEKVKKPRKPRTSAAAMDPEVTLPHLPLAPPFSLFVPVMCGCLSSAHCFTSANRRR
jgi:hypothetical protein